MTFRLPVASALFPRTGALRAFAIAATLSVVGQAVAADRAERIVSIGAAVTETVVELGAAPGIVGIDSTSEAPEDHRDVQRVGYLRALGAEGILSLGPTLVLASAEAGPPGVIDQLRAAGVRCVTLGEGTGIEGAEALIREIGRATERESRAAEVVARLKADAKDAATAIASMPSSPGVLFLVHPPRSGAALVAGIGTPADAMIRLAGARNAAGALSGYAPLTPEAAAVLPVDVIVVPAGTVARMGGMHALLAVTGLASTEAGRSARIVEVEASGLAFGPSTARRMLAFAHAVRNDRVP